MSSFFSNLFGGKSKKNKQNAPPANVKPAKSEKKVTEDVYNDDEELPVMFRRLSLSKSGRMKERKRKNVPISDDFHVKKDDNTKKTDEESNCDLPDSDIFDTNGIIREMNLSAHMSKTEDNASG